MWPLHLLRTAAANLSAGDLGACVAGGLGGKIVRAAVNDHGTADDVLHTEAVREKDGEGVAAAAEEGRKIPGVVVEEPMGAFYLMASLPVDDADKFQYWLLEEFSDRGDTVMFAPGAPFYETPGKGINEVRIAYVLKQQDLERAMDVLAKGIAQYQRTVMKITPSAQK